MFSIITDGWSYPWIAWRFRPWNWQWISAATATIAESGRANGHANRIASSAGPRAAESATPATWRTWCTTSGLLGILLYPTSAVQPNWWTFGRWCLAPYYWVQVCLELGLDTKTRNNKTRQKRDNHKFTTTTASTTAKKKTPPVSTVWAIYIRWKETILWVHFWSLSYMKTLNYFIYPSAHPSTQLRGVPTKEP